MAGALHCASYLYIPEGLILRVRSLVSLAMVASAITLRWKLSRHVWFWITMTFLAALHLPLILFVPWTTSGFPPL